MSLEKNFKEFKAFNIQMNEIDEKKKNKKRIFEKNKKDTIIVIINVLLLLLVLNLFCLSCSLDTIKLALKSVETDKNHMIINFENIKIFPITIKIPEKYTRDLFPCHYDSNSEYYYIICEQYHPTLEIEIEIDNDNRINEASKMFKDCTKIEKIDFKNFNLSNIKYMSHMFDSCSSLTTVDNFIRLNVEDMSYTFYNCTSLKNLDPKFSKIIF